MNALEVMAKLNQLGGANGIGIADILENRLVGMKSRGVYENSRRYYFVSCTQ